MDQKTFGKFLFERRTSLHLSQSFLADKLGYSKQIISNWERGLSYPNMICWDELLTLLKIDINGFINCKNECNITGYEFDEKKFIFHLKDLRIKEGLTQIDLAHKVGTNNKTISSWENGTSLPTLDNFITLSEVLKVDYPELFYGEKIEVVVPVEIKPEVVTKKPKLSLWKKIAIYAPISLAAVALIIPIVNRVIAMSKDNNTNANIAEVVETTPVNETNQNNEDNNNEETLNNNANNEENPANTTQNDENLLNYEGFAYYLQDDETYAFDVGTATELSNLVIPSEYNGKSISKIRSRGFDGCKATNISIPSTVTIIEDHAFLACGNLASINVDVNNAVYSSIDGVLYDKAKTKVIQCPAKKSGVVNLPNTVTTICDSAFRYCSLVTLVNMPEGLTRIENYAFDCASGLEYMLLPSTLNWIGSNALYYDKRIYYCGTPDA